VKLDGSGNIEWQKCLGGPYWEEARSIQQTSDGGYIVAGYTRDLVGLNPGSPDIWIVKLDENGENIEWDKRLGDSGGEEPSSIQQTSDGGYIIAGSSDSNDGDVTGNHGSSDYWVVKLNESGNIEWQKSLGGSSGEGALSIQQTSDFGYITVGHTWSNGGDMTGNHGGLDSVAIKVEAVNPISSTPITVEAGPDQVMEEGASVNFEGSFTASGSHTYSYHWDFRDGSEEDSSLITSHTYADNGTYTVNLTVTDGEGNSGNDTLTVTVNNVAPIVTVTGDVISENGIATVSGTISDPSSTDTYEVEINWGDGNTETFRYPAGSTEFSETHQYLDDNPSGTPSDDYTISVKVTDDDMGEGTASTTVTVNNVAPEVGEINSSVDPIQVGVPVTVDSTFTDAGTLDAHTAVWDWDDSLVSDGLVTETDGSDTVSGTHIYSSADVYKINLTVTDDDSGSNYSVSKYIVIYDPEGGFVTGGGWINSPKEAYASDLNLEVTANFGFVSKYKKGATVPTGVTQFNFQVADLNFHSDTYDWLVIAGSRAQYKGTGTINGKGEYGFMLTATDGELNGGGGSDKFRIKIWNKASDEVIYDNMLDADDDADLTTEIQGGSITIHQEK
jgi:PKD repeat protein